MRLVSAKVKLNSNGDMKFIKFIVLIILDGSESGLDDEEYAASVATLQSLVTTLNADLVLLRKRKVEKGNIAQYLIRKRVDTSDFMEIR